MASNTDWTLDDSASIVSGIGISGTSDDKSLMITGAPTDATTSAYKDVVINLPGTETYVLSGWVKANAVPDNLDTADDAAQDLNKQCGLRAIITYSDNTTEYHYAPFNSDLSDWQFTSITIVPKQSSKTVKSIRIVLAYERNANAAYFDNISLVREAAQTMKYDADGNLVSVNTPNLSADTDTYSNGNLIKTVTGGNGTYKYTYDTTYKHRLISVTNELITQTMGYDSKGNVTSTVLSGTGGKTLNSSATYSSTGNLLSSVTDSSGSTVSYTYGSANDYVVFGVPNTITAPNGTVTTQTIDDFGRITNTSVANGGSLMYTYSKGLLSSAERTAGDTTQTYSFAYDAFGNMTKLSVGARVLAQYEYAKQNGQLLKQTYGNGDTVSFTYDSLGRVKTATYSDGRVLTYAYTGDGQLCSITESGGPAPATYLYTYDTLGRLVNSEKRSGTISVLRTAQTYNSNNQLTKQAWQMGDTSYSESYTYNSADGSLNIFVSAAGITLQMNYDGLRRLSGVTAGVVSKNYTYRDISDTQTTTQVSQLNYPNIGSGLNFGYTYDVSGNIATYTAPDGEVITYTYDSQGQLLSAVGDQTYTYTYDAAGNILTANGHTYTYGDSDWKDLLTAFDSGEISYDASGNPTSYYNGTRWTMTWENGRQLVTATTTSDTEDVTVAYVYDMNGLRVSKTVTTKTYSVHTHNYSCTTVSPTCTEDGYARYECVCGDVYQEALDALGHNYTLTSSSGTNATYTCTRCGDKYSEPIAPIPSPIVPPGEVMSFSEESTLSSASTEERTLISSVTEVHNYTYASGKLLQETITTTEGETSTTQILDFFYDANRTPFALKTNNTVYYYVTNLQGDVIQLVDSTGTAVATYEYDPYGNIISQSGDLADLNPLRYRGYYYDSETGFYYVSSRYYDPEIGRFINADVLVSTGQGLLGNNMFAYCRNNPVCRIDVTGMADADCYDNDPLDEEDLLKTSQGGGGSQAAESGGSTSYSYSAPSGGGGSTSSVQVGNTTVTFGHGGRHVNFSDISGLESAIANDVVTQPPTTGVRGEVFLNYGGVDFTYRYWTMGSNHIHVGTYFYTVAK